MSTRYEVSWCVSGHEDFHYRYFDGTGPKGKNRAFKFAEKLIENNKTFHGCCSIHQEESEKYSDDYGPFVLWQTVKTWECNLEGVVLV